MPSIQLILLYLFYRAVKLVLVLHLIRRFRGSESKRLEGITGFPARDGVDRDREMPRYLDHLNMYRATTYI